MSQWRATLDQAEKDRLELLRGRALELLDETIEIRQKKRKAERRGREHTQRALAERLLEVDDERRALVVEMKLIYERRRLVFETYVWHCYGGDLRLHRRARLSREERGNHEHEVEHFGTPALTSSVGEAALDEVAMWAHVVALAQEELYRLRAQAVRLEEAAQTARRTANETALFECSAALAEARVSEDVFTRLLTEVDQNRAVVVHSSSGRT